MRLSSRQRLDQLAIARARELERAQAGIQCSNLTATWTECIFVNPIDYTANASTSVETSLLVGGQGEQPVIPATFFLTRPGFLRAIEIVARGVMCTTGTPTNIFQVRLGSTSGATFLSGTSIGVSPTITTQNGAGSGSLTTGVWWELRLLMVCKVTGIGSGAATLAGSGYVSSPKGFASPFQYALEPTTPDTGTWTATFDASVSQYINLSNTWGSSSSSNSIVLKQLLVLGLN